MAVKLDPNHFSSKSSASKLLVAALVELQNDSAARLVTKHFSYYLHGMNEILKIDEGSVRNECLEFWHKRNLDLALANIKPRYEELGLPFGEYENVLIHRMREARGMGALMAKMRS